ncbi:UNKNOWN [Stylonychia lemnae]|uniref:Uncharacterized protein n=1 Tax=Stylonychia lemnae TaxID=5949 RepID=A0A078A4Y1_STYLE|nr:UNKNOWN [Stylonychia lemnae]|eukprot:CDW77254.1 UNKNOWN [Stylonychia lemnae]
MGVITYNQKAELKKYVIVEGSQLDTRELNEFYQKLIETKNYPHRQLLIHETLRRFNLKFQKNPSRSNSLDKINRNEEAKQTSFTLNSFNPYLDERQSPNQSLRSVGSEIESQFSYEQQQSKSSKRKRASPTLRTNRNDLQQSPVRGDSSFRVEEVNSNF